MLHILPSSDLKEDLGKIEGLVENEGQTVYLTKNGYGSMVIMSFESYGKITDRGETAEDTMLKSKNKMNTKKINIPQTEIMDD